MFVASAAVLGALGAGVAWQREPTAAAVDGAALFESMGCASCHVGPDSSTAIGGFPPLDDAGEWAGERRDGLTAREYLAESIRSPSAFISPAFSQGGPTSVMPDLGLDDDEIAALVDHLLGGGQTAPRPARSGGHYSPSHVTNATAQAPT